MKLIILPLTVPGSVGKQKTLEKVVDLTGLIPNDDQRIFTLSGVLVASGKFISRDYLEQIRRRYDAVRTTV